MVRGPKCAVPSCGKRSCGRDPGGFHIELTDLNCDIVRTCLVADLGDTDGQLAEAIKKASMFVWSIGQPNAWRI